MKSEKTNLLRVVFSDLLFQNFMVMPDALGITYVNDLSAKDMEKVRSVAFLELTVTFDDHGIPLRPRRPAKIKSTPGKLTGVRWVGRRGLVG